MGQSAEAVAARRPARRIVVRILAVVLCWNGSQKK